MLTACLLIVPKAAACLSQQANLEVRAGKQIAGVYCPAVIAATTCLTSDFHLVEATTVWVLRFLSVK